MKENKTTTIKVEIKDLYQLLISENRYGYTRNNHLMPAGAFDHCKQYLPLMAEKDHDWAVHTCLQLCDECISELGYRFYHGFEDEDEHGSRQQYIDFIEWCFKYLKEDLKSDQVPYNLDRYYDNLAKDDIKKYRVIDQDTNKIVLQPVTFKEARDYIFSEENFGGTTSGVYRKESLPIEGTRRFKGYVYHILEPIERNFVVELIEVRSKGE